jgi:cardiolipin synthase
VKLYRFGPPLIHAKTAVIDDHLAIVGTANLDDRSLKLNFEVAAVCYGPGITEKVAALFESSRRHSVRKHNYEADGPFVQRLIQAGARLLSPQL